LETILARAQARERPVPRFVERELRGFPRLRHPRYRTQDRALSFADPRRWRRRTLPPVEVGRRCGEAARAVLAQARVLHSSA
jgi:hypothetical protein